MLNPFQTIHAGSVGNPFLASDEYIEIAFDAKRRDYIYGMEFIAAREFLALSDEKKLSLVVGKSLEVEGSTKKGSQAGKAEVLLGLRYIAAAKFYLEGGTKLKHKVSKSDTPNVTSFPLWLNAGYKRKGWKFETSSAFSFEKGKIGDWDFSAQASKSGKKAKNKLFDIDRIETEFKFSASHNKNPKFRAQSGLFLVNTKQNSLLVRAQTSVQNGVSTPEFTAEAIYGRAVNKKLALLADLTLENSKFRLGGGFRWQPSKKWELESLIHYERTKKASLLDFDASVAYKVNEWKLGAEFAAERRLDKDFWEWKQSASLRYRPKKYEGLEISAEVALKGNSDDQELEPSASLFLTSRF